MKIFFGIRLLQDWENVDIPKFIGIDSLHYLAFSLQIADHHDNEVSSAELFISWWMLSSEVLNIDINGLENHIAVVIGAGDEQTAHNP